MSIIGHSIQSGVVNVHAALKEQQAGQAARTDEDARRRASITREEERSREAVAETEETRQKTVQNPPQGRRRAKGDDQAEDDGKSDRDKPSAHVDILA